MVTLNKSSAVLVMMFFICTCTAQRPFYASSASYPPVLPQNMPNNTGDLGNRLGESSATGSSSSVKNPVYNVEQELVDRVKDYPRDKQPFWYLNAAQLNSFKNPQQQPSQQLEQRFQQNQEPLQQQQQQLNHQELIQQLQQLQHHQQILQQQLEQFRQQRFDNEMMKLQQETRERQLQQLRDRKV